MQIIHKFEIDLQTPVLMEPIWAVQGDTNSRVLEITLLDGGVAVDTAGCTGIVRYRRADGNGGNYDTASDGTAAVTFAGNVATVQIAPEVLAAPGVAQVAVAIVAGTTILHTFVFQIDVQKNPGLNVTASGGFYLAGTLPDSGWEANKYLGTDAEGKVVALDAPADSGATDEQVAGAVEAYMEENPVEAGATAEQAAQIQANAEDIADIQDPVVSGNTHVSGSTYTLTMPRESGAVDTVVLEFDANGYISKVTENGREILWTTTGV